MRWLLPLLLCACQAGPRDTFYVRSGGADLPVWLEGDPEADTFVVMQHGLGATGWFYDWLPAFDALEERYAVVYWDRRGAGISQGYAGGEITVDQQVDDLGLVLAAVRDRYDPPRLVLMGHSLGGGLSLAFLRDPARAEGIAGYVDVCGGRSLPEAYRAAAIRIVAHAVSELDDPDLSAADRATWTDALAFYDAHPAFPHGADEATHAAYVERVSADLGYDLAASTASQTAFLRSHVTASTIGGPFDALAYGVNTAGYARRFDTATIDLSAEDVATVPVPTLVLTGRYDFSVPWVVPHATYQALADTDPRSRFVVFEASGHFPMWDEPDAFVAEIEEFIDPL